jgi:hypothetical protein
MFLSQRLIYTILFYVLVIILIFVSKPPLFFLNGKIRHFGVRNDEIIFSMSIFNFVVAIVCFIVFTFIELYTQK